MSHRHEIDAILKQVEGWPPEDRQVLVAELLLQSDGEPEKPRRSFGDLLGIGNPTGRHISDEEVERLRFDALAEKHLK